MTIAYRAGNTGGNATGTDVTVTKPTGTVDNDILFAMLYREGGTWTLPAGWTQIREVNDGTIWTTTAWKRASSEGASYVFQLSASTWRTVAVAAYSGVRTSGNPYETDNGQTGTNSSAMDAPTITTTSANDMVVWSGADFSGNAVTTGPAGYSAGPALGGCEIWHKIEASPVTTGTVSGTPVSGTGSRWGAFLTALVEDTGGSGPSIAAADYSRFPKIRFTQVN